MWKKIPNTDFYYANMSGQIKSVDHRQYYISHGRETSYIRKGKVLKQVIDSNGYYCVAITFKNKKQKVIQVHRLIAKTFIPNPENKPQVNHIDGNKLNNKVSNLEWCSVRDNLLHAYKTGLNKGSHHMAGKFNEKHPNSKPIYMCDKDGKILKEFPSLSEATRQTGFLTTHISACARGKRKTCGGYRWIFK